ncbi:MAG: peptidase, partial [Nodosilinea sp.]
MTVSPSPTDFLLQDGDLEDVLKTLLQQLQAYTFPEVAQRIQADIQTRRAGGGYAEIRGGQQLADTLTAQLQQLSGDLALCLHFSPLPLPH